MPLLSSEPDRLSAHVDAARVSNDAIRGSDGKFLRNILLSWSVTDETTGAQSRGALIWSGAVTAAEINASTSYGVLAPGSIAIGPGGKILTKTGAVGTNTWQLVTSA